MTAIACIFTLTSLIIICTTAAPLANKATSAKESSSDVISQRLELGDLFIPPEVITEALFSQVDSLQDELEQCEEMVRNSLRGDPSPESVDLATDDNDNNDREDKKKMARLALVSLPKETSDPDREDSLESRPTAAEIGAENDDEKAVIGHDKRRDHSEEKFGDYEDEADDVDVSDRRGDLSPQGNRYDYLDSDSDETESAKTDSDVERTIKSFDDIQKKANLTEYKKSSMIDAIKDSHDQPSQTTQSDFSSLSPFENISSHGEDTNVYVDQDYDFDTTESDSIAEESSRETISPLQKVLGASISPGVNESERRKRTKRSLSREQKMAPIDKSTVQQEAEILIFGTGHILKQAEDHAVQAIGTKKLRADQEPLVSLDRKTADERTRDTTQRRIERTGDTTQRRNERQEFPRVVKLKPVSTTSMSSLNPREKVLSTRTKTNLFTQVEKSQNSATQKPKEGSDNSHLQALVQRNINVPTTAKHPEAGKSQPASESVNMEDRFIIANTAPAANRLKHRLAKRNVEEHLNSERYVPLIGQLVDRLKYLKDSLVVCQKLLIYPSQSQ